MGESGRKGELSSDASFLARRFFLCGGVYLFISGDRLPHPWVPIRSAPQPMPSGQVSWEEGRETLTGPFAKATKVLSVPMLKPAEPALQKFIQQVRLLAGSQSICLSVPLSLGCCGSADSWPRAGARVQAAGLECWRRSCGGEDWIGESQAVFNFPGGRGEGGPLPGQPTQGVPKASLRDQARVEAGTPGGKRILSRLGLVI